MAKKRTKSIAETILASALSLAEEKPWHLITLAEISTHAKIDLMELRDLINDKTDILVLYGRHIDRKVLEACNKPDTGESEKNRLFEVLMERFDILNEDKNALISILNSIKTDPKTVFISLPHLKHSMMWMYEAAGISTNGLKGAGKILGLTLAYLHTLRSWKNDDTPDMAKTMATLDQSLTRLEKASNFFVQL